MSRILCEDLCAKRRAETCRANLVNNMWVENLSGMIRKFNRHDVCDVGHYVLSRTTVSQQIHNLVHTWCFKL